MKKQLTFSNNGEVIEEIRKFAHGVPKGFRNHENADLTNNYVKEKIKKEYGYDVSVTSHWDKSLNLGMGRIMMFSPVNGAILNFWFNP